MNKLQRYQSEQRTKQAPLNLARIGAQKDTKGLVHIPEKGTKKFFKQRRNNIINLNKDTYQIQDSSVKVNAEEYSEYQ